MKKILAITAILALFASCGDKKNIVFEPLKNETLAYTSKGEIIKGTQRVLIVATYLNPISKAKIGEENERFILAINPSSAELNTQSVAINNDNNVSIKELSKDDALMEFVSFNLPWAKYYELSTPKKQSDKLKLNFEIYHLGEVGLEFVKIPKSLYWNP
ncbi:MAG: hypothetical protein K5978_00555 [Campylobacter sp.]|nr:hypothetical protein [Campylobacter sp.]